MEQSSKPTEAAQDEHHLPRIPKRDASGNSQTTLTRVDNTAELASSKRRCISPPTESNTRIPSKCNALIQLRSSQVPLHSILHLPESQLWSLCKGDLRTSFLALQSYARSPYPLPTTTSSACPPAPMSSSPVPFFLRLPLEIRQQIYALLLPPPVDTPIRGPHPRQLQNPLHFTQPIPANLLLLNHQIRMEALSVLYGAPKQVAHVSIDYNLWAHKTARSDLVLSSLIPSSLRHIHITVHLGSEKRPLTLNKRHANPSSSTSSSNNSSSASPPQDEAATRLLEVKKGIKKLLKWLGSADIKTLTVSWQEPPQTYRWEQKREVLEGLRGMGAERVVEGSVNWGLEGKGRWNRGRRYRWVEGWVEGLSRGSEG